MQQLHPRAVWLFFLKSILTSLFIVIILGSFFSQILLAILKLLLNFSTTNIVLTFVFGAMLLFFLAILFAWIWAKLSYHFYKYEVRDDGFRKEQGVIWKRYVTIPYERIQNVDIYRGLLDRMLGLSDLRIQTAGFSGGRFGGSAEGSLPGLEPQVAEQLRDELVHRARGAKNQGL